jgi:hypothetical protein
MKPAINWNSTGNHNIVENHAKWGGNGCMRNPIEFTHV